MTLREPQLSGSNELFTMKKQNNIYSKNYFTIKLVTEKCMSFSLIRQFYILKIVALLKNIQCALKFSFCIFNHFSQTCYLIQMNY